MNLLRISVSLGLLFTLELQAKVTYDRKDKIKGVSLQTGKEADVRTYRGYTAKTLPHSIQKLKQSITNFSDKCNNGYRKKREFTDRDFDCKFHNENVVESFIVKNIDTSGWVREHGEIERFVVGRRTYNRGLSGYYELVQIYEGKNKEGHKTLLISQKMLTNKEVSKYTEPKIEQDTPFNGHTIKYILTEVTPAQTELKYVYRGTTDHWILNKELSIPQVFSSISKSVNDLVATLDKAAATEVRTVASEND